MTKEENFDLFVKRLYKSPKMTNNNCELLDRHFHGPQGKKIRPKAKALRRS